MNLPKKKVIVLAGPTATGKSALAEALACHLDGEIISADSMQVYRGMDIGTAKLAASERSVPYHCIDVADPGDEFNAFQYQKEARKALADIESRAKQAIVCGGTGLYLRAALEEFVEERDEGETRAERRENETRVSLKNETRASRKNETRAERRERLEAEAQALGAQAFHAKLAKLDPKSAELIHANNVRRVVRAFEWLEDGSSYAEQVSHFDEHKELYPSVYLGIDMPREQLYQRINARVDRMMEQGLLAEVEALLSKGYRQALTAQQAIGYKELVPVLEGEAPLEQAVEQIKQATRHYAKRQKAWFRRDKRIIWLDARQALDDLVTQALKLL